MKKCLVIGASSFIGVYTVEAFLEAGYVVVGTGRNPQFQNHYASLGVDYIKLDLDNPTGLSALPTDVDVVIHLAGRLPANSTFDLESEDDAEKYIRTNTLGMAALLDWCRKNGIHKIISTTSYADVQNRWNPYECVTESWPRDFKLSGDHAAYVISKNAACDLMSYYNEQYGMTNVMFRLPPVYGCGPHDSLRVNGLVKKSGIGLFIEKARRGEPITVFGDAEAAVRDVVYVKDVAQAFVRSAESDEAKGLYNIGSGNPVSLLEQAETIACAFEGKEGKSVVQVDSSRPNDIAPYCFDITRAKQDFDYSPKYSVFRDLIEDWKLEEERGVMPALFQVSAQGGGLNSKGIMTRVLFSDWTVMRRAA